MSKRCEFPGSVRSEIIRRSMQGGRDVICEGCGLVGPKEWHVDHTIPDALFNDKKRKLTAADGKVLCAGSPESCHGKKTPQDVKIIAKAKRRETKSFGKNAAKPTGFNSPDRAELNERKDGRAAARGAKPRLPPYMPRGFVSATER